MANQPSMQELMAKAQEMQKQMQRAQREITALEVVGQSGGGIVKIRMNGAHQALDVYIAQTAKEEIDMLADLIAAAINDAVKKIEDETKRKMVDIAKTMKLPEDFTGSQEE